MIKPYSELELLVLFSKENKTTLMDFYFNPIASFSLNHYTKTTDDHSKNKLSKAIAKKSSVSKSELIDLCAKIYSNHKLLTDFSKSLSTQDKAIFDKAVWKEKVFAKELKELLGIEIYQIVEVGNGFGKQFNIVYDKSFRAWSGYLESNISEMRYNYDLESVEERINVWISFPKLKRMIYSSVLPKPKGSEFEEYVLPENLLVFSFEDKIFQELPLLIAYHLQQKIKYSQKGVPSLASVRKMGKELKIEFFPLKQFGELRGMMLTGLLSENFKYDSLSETPLSILRRLFSSSIEKLLFPPIFLPNLKGINKLYYSDYNDGVTKEVLSIIKALPVETWISKNNLLKYVDTHFCDLDLLNYYYVSSFQNILKGDGGYLSDKIKQSDMHHELTWPNLFGYFYLFAAFGLMEIAIDRDRRIISSYYDDFVGFKLTKLGAYSLSLTDNYEMPVLNAEVNLIFEEDSLFVRVEGNGELAAAIIGSYVVKVSDNKFQFSSEVFLKDCKSTHAIENKIEIFKAAVGKDLPRFWLMHLESLVANSVAIVQDNFVVVFRLPPENKELIRIVAQDAELKKIIIKAEQFHVLVQRKNYNAFISRMKHFGFVINSF